MTYSYRVNVFLLAFSLIASYSGVKFKMSTLVGKEEAQSPYSNPEPESDKTHPFTCNVCKQNYSRVDHLARYALTNILS
jgi:flagellar basal body-associated protein FliL